MDEEYCFRVANISDVKELVEFNYEMALETESKELNPELLKKGIAGLLSDPDKGFYFVAEHKADGVVGALMVTKEWSDWRNGYFWWIQSVFIEKNHRRKRVYSKLHSKVKCLALESDLCCGLRLYVEKANTVAQETYISLGMQETNYKFFEEVF